MSNRAITALTVGALLIGGLLGRASASSGSNSSSPKPKPTPTATTSSDPTALAHEHSPAGAATAGSSYTAAFVRAGLMPTDQRQALLGRISTTTMAEEIEKSEDVGAEPAAKLFGLPQNAAQVVDRLAPLGWRPVAYTGDSATVSIWMVAVFGERGVADGVVPQYKTSTVALQWDAGRRLWLLAGAPQPTEGPTPVAGDSQASSDVLATQDMGRFDALAIAQ